MPVCSLFLFAQWRIHRKGPSHSAYELSQWSWLAVVLLGTTLQRTSFSLGLHPLLTTEEASVATLYHFHWGMVAVMLHLQLVSFELRVTMLIAIFLSLATVNWHNSDGWTYNGQPADTINIAIALCMGEMVGYFAERSNRETFAKAFVEVKNLQTRLDEDEELLNDLAAGLYVEKQLQERPSGGKLQERRDGGQAGGSAKEPKSS